MPLKNGRTTAALQAIVVGNTIPAGVIQAFGGGTVPTGWLLCDGSVVSRTTYAGLFSAVGVANGNGDGSTTFHLPDIRGRFLRGADDMGTGAAGRDPDAAGRTAANAGGNTGNTVGSVEADAHQNIIGEINSARHLDGSISVINGTLRYAKLSGASNGLSNGTSAGTGSYKISIDASRTNKTSSETRPQNANASYIIKV